jgi:hypothetical protein
LLLPDGLAAIAGSPCLQAGVVAQVIYSGANVLQVVLWLRCMGSAERDKSVASAAYGCQDDWGVFWDSKQPHNFMLSHAQK